MSSLRICSFLPSATEAIYSLGLEDRLYGVTHKCDFPEKARSKPKLTSSPLSNPNSTSKEIDKRVGDSLQSGQGIYELDIKTLTEARPDIIFTQELCEVCAVSYGEIYRASQKLPKRPEIVSLDTFTLEDILKSIETIGEKCEKSEEAMQLVISLRNRIEKVSTSASKNQYRSKVLFLEWIDPMMIGGHWIPEVVEIAGGHDVLGQSGKNSRRISWEEMEEYSPEHIVIAPCGFGVERAKREARTLEKLKGWDELPAVKNKEVYIADGNAYFSRPGPRIANGIEILACILNPALSKVYSNFNPSDYLKLY